VPTKPARFTVPAPKSKTVRNTPRLRGPGDPPAIRKHIEAAREGLVHLKATAFARRREADEIDAEILKLEAELGIVPPPAERAQPVNGHVEEPVELHDGCAARVANLRETAISKILEPLAADIAARLERDCDGNGIQSVEDLLCFLWPAGPEEPNLLEDLCSVAHDAELLRVQLGMWSHRNGFAAADIDEDYGLPGAWVQAAERDAAGAAITQLKADLREAAANGTDAGTDARGEGYSKTEYQPSAAGTGFKTPTVLARLEPSKVGKPKLPALPDATHVRLREALEPGWKGWDDLRQNAADDAALATAIKMRLFAARQSDRWSWRENPLRFWPTKSGHKSGAKGCLEGAELLDAVRDVMQLKRPETVHA
jgi:hypothetical protein